MQESICSCPTALNALDLKQKWGREHCPGAEGLFFTELDTDFIKLQL